MTIEADNNKQQQDAVELKEVKVDTNEPQSTTASNNSPKICTIPQLFSFASKLDTIFILISVLASLGSGAMLPLVILSIITYHVITLLVVDILSWRNN